MTRLAARQLSAGYGKVPVVRELELDVAAGEVVGLIGPNGAGKTTTLLALAGQLTAMSGTVELNGTATRAPVHRRARAGLALVPEQRAVFKRLTVADNLRLGRGTIDDAIAIAPELAALLRRRAGLLSGGEQQMLVLARALAARPEVVLADELSLGLAPQIVRRMAGLLRVAADDGAAVLVVEQRLQNILPVVDRVIVLRRGRIALRVERADIHDRLDDIRAAYLGPTTSEGEHP